ncbi:hypothetical protein PIB30_018519 [Stylosanthes scabra]|uniref:Retrotransposon Copia-like N-terminal domain-containing protein n=1 Tax=Stylosanthes scabra TaxID=79078 RepID=A0ABU6Y6J2_9FABA|nr:hypothetical protein [Stylosanthes scabra]
MALLVSTYSNFKNGLIPLANKLDDKNFSTWKKNILLTLRTLKLPNRLNSDETLPQFEETLIYEAASESINKEGDAKSVITNKKVAASGPKILQESDKYSEWV